MCKKSKFPPNPSKQPIFVAIQGLGENRAHKRQELQPLPLPEGQTSYPTVNKGLIPIHRSCRNENGRSWMTLVIFCCDDIQLIRPIKIFLNWFQ
jgi:hypothetical protein